MAYLEKTGSHYTKNGEIVDGATNYRGLFNFLYGENNNAASRFGFWVSDDKTIGKFIFNLPAAENSGNWYQSFKNVPNKGWANENENSIWNQNVPEKFNLGENIYLTMVFDGIGERESLYVNGESVAKVSIDGSYWDGLIEDFDSKKIHSILLGAGNLTNVDWWHLTEMDCYAIRLYSRAFTDKEVLENYNMTVSYHEFLEKGKSVVGTD